MPTTRSTDDIADIIRTELGSLLEGTQADIDKFAHAIAIDVAIASANGDQESLDHLKAQLRLIAGTHRLAASQSGWKVFEIGLGVLTRALLALLLMVSLTGCVVPGQLVATDIKPAVDLITADYDRALRGEVVLGALTLDQKRIRHRSAELLRGLIDAAVAQGAGSSPATSPADPGTR